MTWTGWPVSSIADSGTLAVGTRTRAARRAATVPPALRKAGWGVSDLHFPLALLAYGCVADRMKTRGDAIMAWACDSRGRAKMEEEEVNEDVIAKQFPPDSNIWKQVEKAGETSEKWSEEAFAWAAGTLTGWHFPCFDHHRKTLNEAKYFVWELEKVAGPSPFVRVPSAFAAEALGWGETPPGMTYREFSALCAVYSCTGASDCGIVRREQVRLRQAGAWNEKAANAIRQRYKALDLLSLDQIRYTMDELEGRGLFRRVVGPNKRDTYFTRHLEGEKFVARVASMVKRRHARKEQRATTQAMLDAALAKSQ